MAEPLRLYGLNALVLNAADGIGEAIARTLVKHGATVIAADTANSGVEQHFASVRGVHGLARLPVPSGNQARKAAPVDIHRGRQTSQLEQRGHQVDQLDQGVAHAARARRRCVSCRSSVAIRMTPPEASR